MLPMKQGLWLLELINKAITDLFGVSRTDPAIPAVSPSGSTTIKSVKMTSSMRISE